MTTEIIIVAAACILPILLYYEYKEERKGMVPVKTALSILFVVTVLIQPTPIPVYFRFMLLGLICCLMGDIFLALPQERMFRLGLAAFLIGHVFYVVAFFATVRVTAWTWWGTLGVLVVSGGVYLWLKPHLGKMKGPVLAYIVVISLMVAGAWSIFGASLLPWSGRILVFTGAVCFYVSDLFVARDRFVKKEPLNRFAGLPLYYGGQFLLAFSVGQL